MGVDRNSYAVIGIKIKLSFPREVIEEPSCKHEFKGEHRYCPYCGKESKFRKREVMSDEEDKFIDYLHSGRFGFNNYVAVFLGHSDETKQGKWIIGYGVNPDGGEERLDIPDMDVVKSNIKKILETGMQYYNEETFGLWGVDAYS